MRSKGVFSMEADRLMDRLSGLQVQGKVVEKKKRVTETRKGRLRENLLIVRFKDREFEKIVSEEEFDGMAVGEVVRFTPPVPECNLCPCFSIISGTLGLLVGIVAIWATYTYVASHIASVLLIALLGWICIGSYVVICARQRNNFLKDLKEELRFFESDVPAP
jgi:hypothetical protein